MKFFKKNAPFGTDEENNNRRIMTKLKNRLGHIRRKMSRGASNIYRSIRDRCKWGNKQLFGPGDKGNQKRDHE